MLPQGAQLIGREAHFPSAVMLGAPPKAKALNVLPPPGRDVPGGGRGNGNNNQPTPPHPKANGKDNKTPPIPRTPKPTKFLAMKLIFECESGIDTKGLLNS